MSHLFPNNRMLQQSFAPPPNEHLRPKQPRSKATPSQARPELYVAYSVVDDAKDKAKKLSAEAQHEFDKASKTAQAKSGKIELYSPNYYAACTFGGLLACVSVSYTMKLRKTLTHKSSCPSQLTWNTRTYRV